MAGIPKTAPDNFVQDFSLQEGASFPKTVDCAVSNSLLWITGKRYSKPAPHRHGPPEMLPDTLFLQAPATADPTGGAAW